MAIKCRLPHPSALMLMFISCREILLCTGLTVDPPEDITVLDPGQLGRLEITWSPPSSIINMTECSVSYQLMYFNTYKESWASVRTSRRTYRAQFDLSKDVTVRVYTLLDGPCTNNQMIKSTNFTELIQKPPTSEIMSIEVQDFTCVFYNMEYMECEWKLSPKTPANIQQNLYYWYRSLEKAVQCPNYIMTHGERSGCNFTQKLFPDFTDINFCVNGSSPEGRMKPLFTTLQIQNHVKPAASEKLCLQTGPDKQLELNWEAPLGSVPGHCLKWELEHDNQGPDARKISRIISTTQTNLILPSSDSKERNCFRVRSKLDKYCVDNGFWSDWSHQICHPGRIQDTRRRCTF
ncbi:interleukin-13 receptor subunit alpha-2 isoform X2 [Cololabis saira]|uniref:interleukin-13 receptor subunit alpha-2 isoform X2 n=1 Tax=Cololabis saira TaxID=129043 RepID=UPI002AD3F7C6|nr:interleukin-13 receptor subunit alpha-2 isoform X2 [Cololabis saira]